MLQVYTAVSTRPPLGNYNAEQASVRRAQEDPSAFADLYRQHVKQVYRYVLARVSNVGDAQDLTSQTFLTALESLPNYRGQGAFGAWLMGIARHKVMDHYRQVLPHPEFDLEEADEVVARIAAGLPDAEMEAQLHFLKGSALNLGLSDLAALCQEGERLAGQGRGSEADPARIVAIYEASKTAFLGALAEGNAA